MSHLSITFWSFSLFYAVSGLAITDNNPILTLEDPGSFEKSPIVAIAFPNGHQDRLVLNKHSGECNWIGHLEKESEACVAMTGCIGLEDVQFTIISKHATTSPYLTWFKDGSVEHYIPEMQGEAVKDAVDELRTDGLEEMVGDNFTGLDVKMRSGGLEGMVGDNFTDLDTEDRAADPVQRTHRMALRVS